MLIKRRTKTRMRCSALAAVAFLTQATLIDRSNAQTWDVLYPTSNATWTCTGVAQHGAGSAFCKQDSVVVSVFIERGGPGELTEDGSSIIWGQLLSQFDPTDLIIVWDSTPNYTGSLRTDIIYRRDTNLPTGVDGAAWCVSERDTVDCDQHVAVFRDETPSWAIACHESGHAMGLTHGTETSPSASNTDIDLQCMMTPNLGTFWQISQFQIDAINDNY